MQSRTLWNEHETEKRTRANAKKAKRGIIFMRLLRISICVSCIKMVRVHNACIQTEKIAPCVHSHAKLNAILHEETKVSLYTTRTHALTHAEWVRRRTCSRLHTKKNTAKSHIKFLCSRIPSCCCCCCHNRSCYICIVDILHILW